MSISNKEEVLFCGRNSGRNLDKFNETSLTKEESETIDCPRIGQALGYLECEVLKEIETGDHVLIIGNVLKSEEVLKDKRIFHKQRDEFTTTI
jgi:flavin reductase (DIM6/NTAB) family NADH-FMN oxidoreductase RutF